MYAQTSVGNRTNDRFIPYARQPRAWGPGAESTWAMLEAEFAAKVECADKRTVRRRSIITTRVSARIARFALAAAASGLLVYAGSSQVGLANAGPVLAALMFATGWLFAGLAVVASRWTVTGASLLLAGVLFALAFAELSLGSALLLSTAGLTAGLGAALPELPQR